MATGEQVGDWYARYGYTPHNKTPAGGGLVLHGWWRPAPPPEDDKDEGD